MTNGQLESDVRVKGEYDDDPHIFTVKQGDSFTVIPRNDKVLRKCPHCGELYEEIREGIAIVNLKAKNQHFMVKREKDIGLIVFSVKRNNRL